MASGDAGDLKGLPDRIFNDHREAEVAVLSFYKSSGKTGQKVADYMNVISTNQPLNLSNSAGSIARGGPDRNRQYKVCRY